MSGVLEQETLRQAKAFDTYYAMGDSRSYEAVARKLGVSKTSIARWAKVNNWQERIKERDKDIASKMYEKTDSDLVNTLTNYRKVITASVGEYIKNLKDNKIRIQTPYDFIKLVELDLKLIELINEDSGLSDDTNDAKTSFNYILNKVEEAS